MKAVTPRITRIGDLIEEIALRRRELREGTPRQEQLQREIAQRLEELRRLTPAPKSPVVRNPLESAQAHADVTRFEVPPSHRKKFGREITLAKQTLMRGLSPVLARAFETQRAFNEAALEAVTKLLHREHAAETAEPTAVHPERSGAAAESKGQRATLTQLSDPFASTSRRSQAATLLLRPLLAEQRAFNTLAVQLIDRAARGDPPEVEEANKLIASLADRVDPLHGRELPPSLRLPRPLWAEVFRRQVTFNRELMLVLANLLHGRPPVVPPSDSDYRAWIATKEKSAQTPPRALKQRPLISVVVPAFDSPVAVLEQCLQSVVAQTYERWELSIVDDGSPSARVKDTLAKWAARDPRIRFMRLEKNQGIAAATNAAIRMATGEWIAFLDHDDALAPRALMEIAERLDETPQLDWLYTDEDRLTPDGRERHSPFFKPDFSPELLRSTNYICHFVVARRSIVDALGPEPIRRGFEGSQDYDFLLRLSERSKRVAHIPKILYHWRSSPISLSKDAGKLRAASAAGRRALEEHLTRSGENAEVREEHPGEYRVRYALRGQPLVSIIIPFKDRPELLERLARTLFEKTEYANFELILISNNSKDPRTFALLDALQSKDARVRRMEWNHPFNYPRVNNVAAKEARGELVLFLNNDMEIVDPRWLHELVSHAQRPEVGMVGVKLKFPDASVQHAGAVVGISGYAAHPFWRFPDERYRTAFGHADWNRNYLAVTSACVMMTKPLYDELHGYDERFDVCGSDVDLGIRVWGKGKQVVYTAGTWLYHHESASRRNVDIPENDFWESVVAYRPWLEKGDPFYNPNLTLTSTDCSLRESDLTGLELAAQVLVGVQP